MPDKITYNRRQLNNLLKGVFGGSFTPSSLPLDLHEATIKTLSEGVARGFGSGKLTNEVSELFEHFDHNVAVFSAAKTHQQINDMSRALIDPSTGLKRSFSEFKASANEVFDQYNSNWLRTEYRTAVNQGLGAKQWIEFSKDKDSFPVLRYQTANDERVRKEHSSLDNIVRHIDDPFWLKWFPPNGWNCRCDVTQHEADELKLTSDKGLAGIQDPSALFKGNPALDKVIFDPDHPYISKVAERFHVLRANNFNLPVPPLPKTAKKVRKAKKTIVKKDPVIIKPKHLEMEPDELKDIAGVKMSKEFWPLFKEKVPIVVAAKGKGSFHRAGTVHIANSKRNPKGSPRMKQLISHEFGHAFHYQHNMLRPYQKVDEDFEEFFTRHQKDTFGRGRRDKAGKAIRLKIDSWNKRPTMEAFNLHNAELKEVAEAAGLDFSSEICNEMILTCADTVGAMTMGRRGYGHSEAYYKRAGGYGGRVEVFAHMFEVNNYRENPFITHFFPDYAAELEILYKTLTDKVK